MRSSEAVDGIVFKSTYYEVHEGNAYSTIKNSFLFTFYVFNGTEKGEIVQSIVVQRSIIRFDYDHFIEMC